ncbi:MAG: hypothetical protein ABW101_00425 [Candidatus Thiodiazotropha sp.]
MKVRLALALYVVGVLLTASGVATDLPVVQDSDYAVPQMMPDTATGDEDKTHEAWEQRARVVYARNPG